MQARAVRFVWMLLGIALAAGVACESGESGTADRREATAAVSPVGTLTNADGWPRYEGFRGDRYCEVLLARVIEGRLNAEVWNTYGLNDCPPDEWAALDAQAIKTARGALAVILNGPRFWLMDAIERKPTDDERQTTTFGTLEMFLGATVDIGPVPPNLAPYTERRVARETVFEYSSGNVYELVTADGRVFVMQSYSRQVNPSLTESDLGGLARLLKPPAGWTYRARTLDKPLRVRTAGSEAVVLQDELSNTYQLIESE
jgi:hypothetical protein